MKKILHQSMTDVLQLRALVAVWLALVALRAVVAGCPFDAWFPSLAGWQLADVYLGLTISQLALFVVIAVLIVQADAAVGSTAFWLTRPIGRVSMAASKALTASLLLVVVPVLADVVVLAANHLPAADAGRAIREGIVGRLAIVLPVMALGALTADLGGFVVAAVVSFATFVALLVLVADAGSSRPASESAILLAVPYTALCGGTVMVYQYARRRRRVSAVLVVVSMAALIAGIHWWPWDVMTSERRLGALSLDPRRVDVSLDVAAPRASGRVMGYLDAVSPLPTVIVSPVAVEASLRVSGRLVAWRRSDPNPARRMDQQRVVNVKGRLAMAAAVGEVRIPPTRFDSALLESLHLLQLKPDEMALARQPGSRLEATVTLDATKFEAAGEFGLSPGTRGCAGDRCFAVLAADCSERGCDVLLRDVAARFAYDTRTLSRVDYLVVNRAARAALLAPDAAQPVLVGYSPTMEHIAITHRRLQFDAPDDPDIHVDRSWLHDARLVPVVARDLGVFTRTIVVPDLSRGLIGGEATAGDGEQVSR